MAVNNYPVLVCKEYSVTGNVDRKLRHLYLTYYFKNLTTKNIGPGKVKLDSVYKYKIMKDSEKRKFVDCISV
jgi:hypothetical protein